MTFGEKVLKFYSDLEFDGNLPKNIQVLNPFKGNREVPQITKLFYDRFYSDNNSRKLILGINPGRLGAGATGIPFTDTKRLRDKCGINLTGIQTHEPSSVFIYNMIDAYGGAQSFYRDFYITSVCPLGFVSLKNDKEINYNYYDNKTLEKSATPFILKTLKQQLDFGIDIKVCYCLGTGKNYQFLQKLNDAQKLFEKIIPLEHPRYIMQYKSKSIDTYIEKYLQAFETEN